MNDSANKWVKTLSPKTKKHIIRDPETGGLKVNVTGIFYFDTVGEADYEPIEEGDFEDYSRAEEECPVHGGALFVARKRKIRPLDYFYGYVNPEQWGLFDDCGGIVEHIRTKKGAGK